MQILLRCDGWKIVQAVIKVAAKQTGDMIATSDVATLNGKQTNLVVNDFKQFAFTDPAAGRVLAHNLLTPKNYDRGKECLLVNFVNGAGKAEGLYCGSCGCCDFITCEHNCNPVEEKVEWCVDYDTYREQ